MTSPTSIVFVVICSFIVIAATDQPTNQTGNITTAKSPCAQSPSIHGRQLFFFPFLVIVCITALLGNSLAIIVILTAPILRNQPAFLFATSLAFADLGAALFTLPIRINQYMYQEYFCFTSFHVCQMFVFTDLTFNYWSVITLFVIAVDRFIAICMPFRYPTLITRRVALLTIALVIGYCLTWSTFGMFQWKSPFSQSVSLSREKCSIQNDVYTTVSSFIQVIIPICVMAVLYSLILNVALKQVKAISTLETGGDIKEQNARRRKRERRATRTLATVYGAYAICWMPVTIINVLAHLCFECLGNTRSLGFEVALNLFAFTLPPLNACLNPVIYLVGNKQFRVAFKKLVNRLFGRQILPTGDSTIFQNTKVYNDTGNSQIKPATAVPKTSGRQNDSIVMENEEARVNNICLEKRKPDCIPLTNAAENSSSFDEVSVCNVDSNTGRLEENQTTL